MLVTMGPYQLLVILDGYLAIKLVNLLFALSRRHMKSSFVIVEKLVNRLKVFKLGRPLVLGARLDAQVQLYLKNVREGGGPVTARIAIAAACGIMLSSDAAKNKSSEFGGHIV